VARRWGLVLPCVCVASLAGNVYLYLESKSATRSGPAAAPPAPRPPPVGVRGGASAATPPQQTVKPQTPPEGRAPAAETRPVKTPEECTRMRFEENRAELREPAQRQQAKQNYIANNREAAEPGDGLADLHLSEEQLNRLYELAAEWFVQSAETIPPPRSRWPLDQNPLIAAEFGDEVAQKWGKYQRESSGRSRVRELAGRMALEDVPLTADQSRQMIKLYTALDEERAAEVRDKGVQPPSNEAEAIAMHPGTKERDARYHQKLVDRAASILNSKQLDVLGRGFDQRTALWERHWEQLRSEGKLVKTDADGCVRSYTP
jgi:hypothetical protein